MVTRERLPLPSTHRPTAVLPCPSPLCPPSHPLFLSVLLLLWSPEASASLALWLVGTSRLPSCTQWGQALRSLGDRAWRAEEVVWSGLEDFFSTPGPRTPLSLRPSSRRVVLRAASPSPCRSQEDLNPRAEPGCSGPPSGARQSSSPRGPLGAEPWRG